MLVVQLKRGRSKFDFGTKSCSKKMMSNMHYFVWYKYSNREGVFDYKRDSKELLSTCDECGLRSFKYAEPIILNIVGEPCDFYMVDGHNIVSEKFLEVLRESGFTGFEPRNALVGK